MGLFFCSGALVGALFTYSEDRAAQDARMPAKRNQMVPNAHFHKDWQRYVKCWFNQPARRIRVEKAKRTPGSGASAPRRPGTPRPTTSPSPARSKPSYSIAETAVGRVNK